MAAVTNVEPATPPATPPTPPDPKVLAEEVFQIWLQGKPDKPMGEITQFIIAQKKLSLTKEQISRINLLAGGKKTSHQRKKEKPTIPTTTVPPGQPSPSNPTPPAAPAAPTIGAPASAPTPAVEVIQKGKFMTASR